ncbi:DUF4649 family protein [Lactococcus termiticola]|uniref:DUF4649 domain-containing protein n=1 Tax=Lactococcus termiticola TaxID=2169526 RepID=A0A2R5HDE2_9LACT|nr:DUF4649 family protein [Lactococcus termiticola]GBG96104.1 hypothetical protein NtB2_00208 [Lactococcus termiticola]
MMKFKVKSPMGSVIEDEFESIQEFISLQLADEALYPDNFKVLELEIDGKAVDFEGDLGGLYDYLTAQ